MQRTAHRARRLLIGLALAGLLAGAAGGCANEPEPIIIETPAATGTPRMRAGDGRPTPAPSPAAPTSTPQPPATPAKVNLNTADARALEALPRIGPAMARRIIDYRQSHGLFKTVDDLLDVPGIGPATLEAIRAFITIED